MRIKNIGKVVRKEREAQGLSRRELGDKSKVHQNTVKSIEATGNCLVSNLIKVTRALGMTLIEVLARAGR